MGTQMISAVMATRRKIVFSISGMSKRSIRHFNKDYRHGFIGMVGRTPLIRFKKLSDETGCDITAKAEHLNPGGSVKDRAALYLIKQAEENGTIAPGGTIVEGTAG